jgi:hypothetical protein
MTGPAGNLMAGSGGSFKGGCGPGRRFEGRYGARGVVIGGPWTGWAVRLRGHGAHREGRVPRQAWLVRRPRLVR